MTIPPPYSKRPAPRDVRRAMDEVAAPQSVEGREEIRDFFAAISGLGKRKRQRLEEGAQVELPRKRRWLLVLCGLVVVAGLVFEYLTRRPPSEIPVDLRGAWATTARSYADRGFWIGAHQVAFRVGPGSGDVQIFPVTHLARKQLRADTTVYDIDYAVEGGTDRWSIRHVSLPHPAIVFVHQPQMTWTSIPDPHPPIR